MYFVCFQQEQYIFIHDAILESVTCGDTRIDAGNLRASLNQLLKKNQSGRRAMDLQFAVSTSVIMHHGKSAMLLNIFYQILDQVSLNPKDTKCVSAKQNPKKNRSADFLPGKS